MKPFSLAFAMAVVVLLSVAKPAYGQSYPQGYFRNPLDEAIALSATFAEFRTNHFHAGLDMRTGGVTGKAVHAAADGYVAKVSISAWGGGKILYIRHPNGYTTVYMHLERYAGKIQQAVLNEQYAQRRYNITKLFAPGELPVRKGDVVAYSGNTGSSGGPHLHFEIRRGGADDLHTHATTINPLLFGLPYTDHINPVIRGVRIYPLGGNAVELGKRTVVEVDTDFYVGFYATDAAEGSTAKNGFDHAEVLVDGHPFFAYNTRLTPLDSSRMVNALIDYRHYVATRQAYLLTRSLPGAEGPWVTLRRNGGVIHLAKGTSHNIEIKVYDIAGNSASRRFEVRRSSATHSIERTAVSSTYRPLYAVNWCEAYSQRVGAWQIDIPAKSLYANDQLLLQQQPSPTHYSTALTIQPTVNDLPPQGAYTLAVDAPLPQGVLARQMVIMSVDGRQSALPTTCKGNRYTASVRQFGQFALGCDTVPPAIAPVNVKQGRVPQSGQVVVRITDNLSGVDNFHCYLNNQWILGEYDGKTARVAINVRGKLQTGANTLRIEATDACGNTATYQATIR